jgi:hypothetical protein
MMPRRNVHRNIGRNKVAIDIERGLLRKYCAKTIAELEALVDGVECGSALQGISSTIVIAGKSIEGMEGEDQIHELFAGSIAHIIAMTTDGNRWRAAACDSVCDSLDVAIQIITQQDPASKLKALRWHDEQEAILIAERLAQVAT